MTDTIPRYYWDACAWIGFINEEPKKITPLRAIWSLARGGKCEIWTSAYSYVEVFKLRAEDGDEISPEESDAKVEAMFSQPHVSMVQVDQIVAKLARNLRRQYGEDGLTRRPDAIHLAAALYYNLDELHTWDDKHLIPLNGKVARRDGQLLPILKPGGAHVVGPMFGKMTSDDFAPNSDQQPKASQ